MKRLLKLLLPGLLLFSGAASARLNIEITEGVEGALPIAVVPFADEETAPQPVGAIVAADLKRSGRFAPLATDHLPARPVDGSSLDYAVWRSAGVENLVVGKVMAQKEGYVVQFQLFDVIRGVQLAGYSIPSSAAGLRRTAHQIADLVYQKITGERGAFDTRIAYVTVAKGDDGKRSYQLAVADADGYDEQVILTSPQPLMSPAWSPDAHKLAYVSFEEGHSTVYVQDVTTGAREKVADFKGINSAPAFSPDGRRLALTLSRDGDAEIYVLDLASKRLTRITRDFSIDTEAAWSPDGGSLIFTSDRGGTPQLYRVSIGADGPLGRPQRLTFEGNYNARASWSSDGKQIALLHGENGTFRIAVMDLATQNLRVLTRSQLDESPSFAPNGRMIIYATEVGGRGVLAAVSVDGRAHQRLGLSRGDVREPAWSPFLAK